MGRPQAGTRRPVSVAAIVALAALVAVPTAAAAFEDRQTDAAGDVTVYAQEGEDPDVPHLDITNVTGTLDGVAFSAVLTLTAAPSGIGGNDSLNYQVLMDVEDGTRDGYPPGSGWDVSVVCQYVDGVHPDTCTLYGANGSIQRATFQGSDLVLDGVFEAGFQVDRFTVGAGAAQQRQAGQQTFTALDFTPNADIDQYLTETPTGSPPATGGGEADDGVPWLGIGLGALAGIGVGIWWARRRKA